MPPNLATPIAYGYKKGVYSQSGMSPQVVDDENLSFYKRQFRHPPNVQTAVPQQSQARYVPQTYSMPPQTEPLTDYGTNPGVYPQSPMPPKAGYDQVCCVGYRIFNVHLARHMIHEDHIPLSIINLQ
ncbi:hypothetical protein RF11_15044 [Thelohanellus kitauei]|uniref:Uncharacterized protein n=1 Tax=Thelohanellus kitauei TaxID=669202 RepID=A0A0C2MHJ4_THEKT|nr:hypothetical protein RF11_15044 [Thelohanellus kitauei]